MRYLTFDIECCDGVHICEFGYVITDDKFNVLEKNVFVMNPEAEFCLTGRMGAEDFKLYYSEDEYYAAPAFPEFHSRIKELLEHPEQVVIGHAVSNDINFLRTACKRYELSPMSFDFVDSQRAYREYSDNRVTISLKDAEDKLHLEKPEYLHKSDEDAKLTMLLLSKICEELEVTVPELKKLCLGAFGRCEDLKYTYRGESFEERYSILSSNPDLLSGSKINTTVGEFAERIEPSCVKKKNKFSGKYICFSIAIIKAEPHSVLKLMRLLTDGGSYCMMSAKDANVYIASDEELSDPAPHEKSLYGVARSLAKRGKMKIYRLDEFVSALGLNDEALSALPLPEPPPKRKNDHMATSNKTASTLRDNMIIRGDLSKFLKPTDEEEG